MIRSVGKDSLIIYHEKLVASAKDKKDYILDSEYKLANKIAAEILRKPELNIWMILIPIVFVYYFYDLNRYSSAKKDFVRNFVLTRKYILEEACAQHEEGNKPDFQEMAKNENVPDCAIEEYKHWASILFEHYSRLLNTDGESYIALIRGRYEERGRFLLIVDQINKAESRFYKALRKDLKGSVEDVATVIKKMESSLAPLRRREADVIFAG
ncbi:NF038143 family protein [bacterium]|nr:NF038143 family protein [bacterium]